MKILAQIFEEGFQRMRGGRVGQFQSNLSVGLGASFLTCLIFLGGSFASAEDEEKKSRPLVEDKYRITEDRKKFDELRKEVPTETQLKNDELALELKNLSEGNLAPDEVRRKFDSVLRKKRETFNRDLQKEREIFNRDERKSREAFQKEQLNSRNEFLKSKKSRDERQDFFREQDEKRREFFADSRDKRNEYEADVRERRKNFEDYAREKQNRFFQEWRSYSQAFNEKKRQEKLDRESQTGGGQVPSSTSVPDAIEKLEVGQ